ncbi:hypothetical protein [Streptacidiphilus monticola]|uniref:Twin-arginine translocation signal domain-containing protein n=1 Tax=Streptacidiphilus monticola TaxID=2161674 RepID=A0ABW1G8B4_9ACTN
MPEIAPGQEASSPLTRRGLIKNAATAGAAVAAAGLLAGASTGQAHAASLAETAAERAADLTEPLMVRVADARTGALDIFHGDTHHTVHNRNLAQALINAAR